MEPNLTEIKMFRQKIAAFIETKKHEKLNELIESLNPDDPTEREMLFHYIVTHCASCPFTTLINLYVTNLYQYADQDIRLLRVLAAAYEKLQLYDLGLSVTDKLAALGDTGELMWSVRSFCLHQLGRTDEVMALALKVLPEHQDWDEIRFHLSVNYIKKHDISKAQKELDLLTSKGFTGIEDFHEHLKDWTPEKYRKHRLKMEVEAKTYCLKAIELTKRGEYREAAINFSEALVGDPKSTSAYTAYGDLLEAAGLPVESLSLNKRALKLDPTNAKANLAISKDCYYAADIQGAMDYCRKALEYEPDFYVALNLLGDIYCNDVHDHDAASKCYNRSLDLFSKQEGTWMKLGYSFMMLSNKAEAEIAFRRALDINPDSQALVNLGDLLKSKGAYEEAVKSLNRFLQVDPNSFDAMALLGEILNVSNKNDDVYDLIAKAKTIEATDFDNLYWKGRLLQLGDRVEAIKCYERYLKLAAEHSRPLAYLEVVKDRLQALKEGLH